MKQFDKKIEQVKWARRQLGLDEYASLEEIRQSFRKLSLKYHPDRCQNKQKNYCAKKFKQAALAKEILTEYCSSYRYSFKEPDIKRSVIDKDFYEHLMRFYDGWLGDLDL